jgi:hypothetical protein
MYDIVLQRVAMEEGDDDHLQQSQTTGTIEEDPIGVAVVAAATAVVAQNRPTIVVAHVRAQGPMIGTRAVARFHLGLIREALMIAGRDMTAEGLISHGHHRDHMTETRLIQDRSGMGPMDQVALTETLKAVQGTASILIRLCHLRTMCHLRTTGKHILSHHSRPLIHRHFHHNHLCLASFRNSFQCRHLAFHNLLHLTFKDLEAPFHLHLHLRPTIMAPGTLHRLRI